MECEQVGYFSVVTMATAQPSSGDMDTKCCVCHDFFTEPKLLPCAHVVCRACLLSWLASSPEGHCPVCRRAVCHPETVGSRGWEQMVDGLPTDVIMAELVKAERVLSQDKVCGGCKAPAVSICLHCTDIMCRSCRQAHKNFSATRQHTIADLTTMTPGVLAASQPGYCDSHPDKLAELFCPSHKKPICHVCASTKHRACPQLLELGEAAQKYREKLKTKEANLKKQLQEVEKVLAQMVRGRANIEIDYREVLVEINNAYDRVVNHANRCKTQSKQRALRAKTEAQASLRALTAPVLKLKAQLTSDLRLTVRSSNAATNKSIFDVSPMLESQVKGADVRATLSRNEAVVKRLTFSADPAVRARIENDLSDLGSLHVTSASILVKDLSPLDDSEAPAAKRPCQVSQHHVCRLVHW